MVTVSNYLEIFIKNYVLLPLPPFKTNLRRAVSENRKLYFWDLGIRNALIKDFRAVEDYQKCYWTFEIKSQLQTIKSIFPLPHQKAVITPDNFKEVIKNFTRMF